MAKHFKKWMSCMMCEKRRHVLIFSDSVCSAMRCLRAPIALYFRSFVSSALLIFLCGTNWWIIHLYSIIIYQTDSWFLKLRNRAKEKKIEFFNRMKTSVFVVKSEIKIKKQTVRLCLLKLFERLLLESQECRRIYSLKK